MRVSLHARPQVRGVSALCNLQAPLRALVLDQNMNPNQLAPPRIVRILRLPDVCRVTGLGCSMIYQLEADRHFPSRIKLATRAVGWIEEEVQAWLLRRIENSRDQ